MSHIVYTHKVKQGKRKLQTIRDRKNERRLQENCENKRSSDGKLRKVSERERKPVRGTEIQIKGIRQLIPP